MRPFSRARPDAIGASLRADASLSRAAFPRGAASAARGPAGALSYAEYGAAARAATRTMLFLHGTPGTRLFFSARHAAHAAAHAVRVVVPERPGFGASPPRGGSLLAHAADCAALLDGLGVDRACVVAYSAGGPYALAFARRFPRRCAAVAVVSSLSPNVRGVARGMSLANRLAYFAAARAPRPVLRALVWLAAQAAVRQVFEPSRADFTEEENAFFREREDVRRLFAESTLELYAREGGARAEADDYARLAADWGFDLADVAADVWLYGAANDDKCTPAMFRELERGLAMAPGKLTARLVEGPGHLMFYDLFEGDLFRDIGLVPHADAPSA